MQSTNEVLPLTSGRAPTHHSRESTKGVQDRVPRRPVEAEEMLRPRRLNAEPSGLACLDVLYLIFWLELVLRLEPPKNASWGQHEVVRQLLKVRGHEDLLILAVVRRLGEATASQKRSLSAAESLANSRGSCASLRT